MYERKAAVSSGTTEDAEGNGPASGVLLLEIGGTDPDGEELPWLPAEDTSQGQEEPWSEWSAGFLPSRSGTYRLSARATDEAGNATIREIGALAFEITLMFRGPVYVWPNPLSRSQGDVGHFSFETNQAASADARLSLFDVSGALVYSRSAGASKERTTNSASLTWDLLNMDGRVVASGIYVFHLEVTDGRASANETGRLLVVR